jgi:D-aspartate ligase
MNHGAPVVVLGVHYGSLGIARSLGRLGVPVHGVHEKIRVNALASRYFRRKYCWDFVRSTADESVAFLRGIGKDLGESAVLLPTTDDTAQLVADRASDLQDAFRFQDNPPGLVNELRRKWEMSALAKRHGVPAPETRMPATASEALQFAGQMGFPLLLKSSDGAKLEARGLPKMVIVRSASELAGNFSRMEDPANANLMLQEYIPGSGEAVWMFNGYFDRNSDCVAGFTGRKLRQHPIRTGATSLGICQKNETVHRLTTGFMKAVGYRGIVDIGFRYDARDGRYKLLDVNPRIGATFRLFVGTDGTDVARLLYLDLTGQPLPSTEAREGRRWHDEHRDYYSVREHRREGSLSGAGWLRTFIGADESAWFAWDDPFPAIRTAGAVAVRGLQKACRLATRSFMRPRTDT